MTDGMLVRDAIKDPKFRKFAIILLDEIHERTLNTDFLMMVLKRMLPERSDFRLVVMSATVNAQKFTVRYSFVC